MDSLLGCSFTQKTFEEKKAIVAAGRPKSVERSFSSLKRIKSFSQNKMEQDRLSDYKTQIIRTTVVKYLGVTLDDSLIFKNHLSALQSKIARSIGILFRLRQFMPQSVLLILYY